MTVISASNVGDFELSADGLNAANAAAIYKEHGCLVVRGLMTSYIEQIEKHIEQARKDNQLGLMVRGNRRCHQR